MMMNLPHLGLGGGVLGLMEDDEAFRLLDAAADVGVGLVDVARSYGDAEERLGRWLRARPQRRTVVVTKGGYGVDAPEWTGEAITRGIDDAVRRLSRVDAFLLHSCQRAVLERDDVGEALGRALDDGKVGAVGYSGDNDDLHYALDRARQWRFSVVESSLSLLDGKARMHTLPRARALRLSVICKRALANVPWVSTGHQHPDHEEQRRRFLKADLPDTGIPLDELFLRFAAFTPGVSSILIGTRRIDALLHAVNAIHKGPLWPEVMDQLQDALARCDEDSVT